MLTPCAPGEIRLDGVSRSFGARRVLTAVDLQLAPGSIAEIVGGNGVGKTSLLRILAGTLTPDSGTVMVSGFAPGRGLASLVPVGDRALYWRLTVQKELEFFARLANCETGAAADVAQEAAIELGLTELMHQQIGTLSTGQRRRVMVARSLVSLAPVLLLDEPYSDLDESGCWSVDQTVSGWVERGGVALWTSPSPGGGPRSNVRKRLEGGVLTDA